ncbi:HTH-type transcriptional regulator AlsR [Hyella patelloides LEGE 07179]|uniref:HTH-type transcriptional regulator AlsR n=1 Tax=Hyella patelloides LEGE 07179 TaxID=945734 RepID=A0A563W3Q8_9CYAN|nr:LysR substrate-binding domain-containing protein [Hyella patelloides]VEP18308.1 HTH-type transcriptional regulator AlsR [Hyella patelloides LEGE 07179]
MELRQLKYFVAVAEELNFRRAAEKLYIQQPPLSRQIRQLETELGIELFQRSKRSVSLTKAGKAFLDEARLTLAQAQRAVNVAQQATKTNQLIIGFSLCAFDRILPELIDKFRQQHPETPVNLIEMTKESQIQALLTAKIDVGFCYAPITNSELDSVTILSEPLVVVLPPEHPLVEQESIELRSLKSESFILCPKDIKPDAHEQIMQLCDQAGFQPKIVQEASPSEVQLRLVESGMGISLIAASCKTRHNARVVYLPLVEPVPLLTIAAVWHKKQPSLALSNFIKDCLFK